MENQGNVQQPELQVTSTSVFKQRRAERNKVTRVELPSGNVFELRRPDIVKLIRQGVIPGDVAVAAQAMAADGGKKELTGKLFVDYLKMLNSTTLASVVTPKVKDGDVTEAEYDQGFISVDDIDVDDKEFISVYANTGDTDLSSFRNKE